MAKTYAASQIDFYIFTGETSGDIRGYELLSQLKLQKPLARIHGVPGPKLRTLGVEHSIPMESFQVMGFLDVVKALPKLSRLFHRVRDEILTLNPKGVILVDYPGFTIRLAKALRKAGYSGKIIQFVCPTVWAWKKNRIAKMEQTLDLLLTILPFEPQYFDATKLKTLYVGNPLVEALEPTEEEPSWAPPHNTPFLTIFPGSRETEITRNLPLQLAVAEETKLPIAISCSHEKFFPLIQKISGNSFPIIKPEHTKNLLKTTSFAIATSGTICLELALHNVPTVCSFAIRPLDQFIATKIFKINLPYYCIANIIANKEIFPEYFGSNLTFQSLLNGVQKIINGTHHCETNIVRTLLGEKRTSEEASSAILSTIKI